MLFIKNSISSLVAAALAVGCASSGDLEFKDGLYRVESRFTTPRGLPTNHSDELEAFVNLADHPDKFGGWMLEQLTDKVDGPLAVALNAVRLGVDADKKLMEYLDNHSPEARQEIIALAGEIRSVANQLRLSSEMRLTKISDDDGSATHELTGVTFTLGTEDIRYELYEMDINALAPARADYELHRENFISIGYQDWLLPYGQMLDFALNKVIVERHNPFADSLQDLMVEVMPCKDVGDWLETQTDAEVPDEVFATACFAGMAELFNELLPDDLDNIEGTLEITGDAILIDDTGDGKVDGFEDGEWEGSLAFDARRIRLSRPYQTFSAERSRNVRTRSTTER
jgi:hypothetical protein